MKRVFTATCLAATFAVGLAAQSTSTATQTRPAAGQRPGAGPRTVTGCLRTGDTAGSYMLTDVQMQPVGARSGDTTAGSTAGTAGGTGTSAPQGGRAMVPMSFTLVPAADVDLKPHVGHKVEVTGTMSGGRGRPGGDASTTGAGTSTGTGTTSGTSTGTAASGTSTGAGYGGTTNAQGGRGGRSMNVTAVKMVSESCS